MRPSLATKLAASSRACSTTLSSGDDIFDEADEPTPEVAAPADEPAVAAPANAGPTTKQASRAQARVSRFMRASRACPMGSKSQDCLRELHVTGAPRARTGLTQVPQRRLQLGAADASVAGDEAGGVIAGLQHHLVVGRRRL